MNVLRTSNKLLVSSKASNLEEIKVRCLECNKELFSLLKMLEEEYTLLQIECFCGCKFPMKINYRAKIQPLKHIIEDIDYELLNPHEKPRNGRIFIKIAK